MESDRLLRGATSEEEAATSSPPCPESDASADLPRVTVIVPVYNGRATLGSCLAALEASRAGPAEVIVVDDASTDGSGSLAAAMGARVIRLEANSGPAAARNRGAAQATGDVLFFVDADVAVAPGAVDRVRSALHGRRDLAALFGSYDRDPPAPGAVSRYKNLLHHFVHQHGAEDAGTFWAGCGAIRRPVFIAIGGFDARTFPRPSIEDIELGCRLERTGHRILLDKGLQGKHLKRWTLRSLLRTDIVARAVPWSRLVLERRCRPGDLNLGAGQRLCAVLVGVAAAAVIAAAVRPAALAVAALSLAAVIAINRKLYAFFLDRGGLRFAAACLLLHWLYYLYSTLVFLAVWLQLQMSRAAKG